MSLPFAFKEVMMFVWQCLTWYWTDNKHQHHELCAIHVAVLLERDLGSCLHILFSALSVKA